MTTREPIPGWPLQHGRQGVVFVLACDSCKLARRYQDSPVGLGRALEEAHSHADHDEHIVRVYCSYEEAVVRPKARPEREIVTVAGVPV